MISLLLLAAVLAGHANAAELSFVLGTIVKPEGANEGDTLSPGTLVQTGSDTMVMVEQRWRSDIRGRDCIRIAIFGYGQSYTVSESETPGRCRTTVPTNPGSLQAGQPFLNRETRYGDAPFDEGRTPDKVTASQAQWNTFDRWLHGAQRTFTGVVTSLRGNKIRVRSSSSNNQRAFSINPSTVDSPAALDTLIDKRVRLDYRITGTGPQTVRIRLTSTSDRAPANRIAKPLSVKIIQQPVIGKDYGEIRPKHENPKKVADHQAGVWKCSLDLHQGDTGTLIFVRKAEKLMGKITVRNGTQKHPISGTWKGDNIDFRRTLSKGSVQPFTGTATKHDKGIVHMAGRFAHEYHGVWSADCELQRDQSATQAGKSSGRYDLVLTGFGDNKIAVIKAVRAVTGQALKDAKDAVENTPYTIKTGVSAKDVRRLSSELRKAGAVVSIDKVK